MQKNERQSYWSYIEVGDPDSDMQPKQKRFWNTTSSPYAKMSLEKHYYRIFGRLFNVPKDKTEILSGQYLSVYTKDDQDGPVPEPDSDPYPQMEEFLDNEEDVESCCAVTTHIGLQDLT